MIRLAFLPLSVSTEKGSADTFHFQSSSLNAVSTTQATSPTSTSSASINDTVNDAWAYNGTGIFALSFNPTTAVSGTNYVVFYQHSNGDLRQVAYNYSQWHDSEYITDDARPGSPITAYWSGDEFNYNLFYADKNNVLQERRGQHGSSTWVNGTLGQLSVIVSDPSDISVGEACSEYSARYEQSSQ